MKEDKMDDAIGTYGEHINAYSGFVGKTEAIIYA